MTAVLTVIGKESVYQVSDRLVSVANIGPDRLRRPLIPYDSAANKSLVYVGVDCRLVLGYTGPSHVGDQATDKWLAMVIRGGARLPEQIEHRWPPLGNMKCRDLLQLLSGAIPDDLTVSIGGYLQTAYGAIPRLWVVYREKVVNSHEETSAVVIPRNAATVATYDEIASEVNSANESNYTSALVAAIQKISTRNPAVGGDVLAVELARDSRRISVGMYFEYGVAGSESLMYAPLALFPGVALAPMRLNAMRSRFAIGPACGISEGPIEDPSRDCEVFFNANLPSGNYTSFHEHVRSLPPWL